MSKMLSLRLTIRDGKPVHTTEVEKVLYEEFLKRLKDGQQLNVFMELTTEDGNNLQRAKIHACIREISLCTGDTFQDTKKTVKRKCGLKLPGNSAEEKFKSFADCSKEELSLVINEIITIGDFLGLNFR